MIFTIANASYLPFDVVVGGSVNELDVAANARYPAATCISVRSELLREARASADTGISLYDVGLFALDEGIRLTGFNDLLLEVSGELIQMALNDLIVAASMGTLATGGAGLVSMTFGITRGESGLSAVLVRGPSKSEGMKAAMTIDMAREYAGRATIEPSDLAQRSARASVAVGLLMESLALADFDIESGTGFIVLVDIIDEVLASARGDAC